MSIKRNNIIAGSICALLVLGSSLLAVWVSVKLLTCTKRGEPNTNTETIADTNTSGVFANTSTKNVATDSKESMVKDILEKYKDTIVVRDPVTHKLKLKKVNCDKREKSSNCTHREWEKNFNSPEAKKERKDRYERDRKYYNITSELIKGKVDSKQKAYSYSEEVGAFPRISFKAWGAKNCKPKTSEYANVSLKIHGTCKELYCDSIYGNMLLPFREYLPEECYKEGCVSKNGRCNYYVRLFYSAYGKNPQKLQSLASEDYGLNHTVADLIAGNKYSDNKTLSALAKSGWGNDFAISTIISKAKGDKEILSSLFKPKNSYYNVRKLASNVKYWKDWMDKLLKNEDGSTHLIILCNPEIKKYPEIIKKISKTSCPIVSNYAKQLLVLKQHYKDGYCTPPLDSKLEFMNSKLETMWKDYPCKTKPSFK